jgi:UDP:flavonoid glycosyltransferase YjiC (YdhE family)
MQKVLFGTVGWNIAETTRMIEIAKLLSVEYECHFFSYGGKFEYLVEEAGFTLYHLEPIEDEIKIQHLWKVDRGETFKQPWTFEELKERLSIEIQLLETIKPSFAFLGSVLSFSLSCRIKKVKLFNVVPLPLTRPYLEAGLPVSPFISKSFNQIAIWILLNVPLIMGNFRKVSKLYGLKPPRNAFDIWSGDINIVTEVKELSLLQNLPENWYFSGPLFAHLDTPIPDHIKRLLETTEKPKVYFAMGSSANRQVLMETLESFDGLEVLVIAPIQSYLRKEDIIPKNVYVTEWLPALEVLRYVDIAVTHGGQGTVQTSIMAGVPFLGIGMQPEQSLNIYQSVKFGNALQIQRNKVNKHNVQKAMLKLINQDEYRSRALIAKSMMEKIDVSQIILSIIQQNT